MAKNKNDAQLQKAKAELAQLESMRRKFANSPQIGIIDRKIERAKTAIKFLSK